jgi:hypothetical protein
MRNTMSAPTRILPRLILWGALIGFGCYAFQDPQGAALLIKKALAFLPQLGEVLSTFVRTITS